MERKIKIMDIELDNCSIRESLLTMDKYLNDTAMNSVQMITMEMLVRAEHSHVIRRYLENIDFTVIDDKSILEVAGAKSVKRISEVTSRDFFEDFMRKIYRSNSGIYLLAEDADDLDSLREYLRTIVELPRIVGEYAVGTVQSDYDEVANDINSVLPDVIFSVLHSPKQEEFYELEKSKLSAKIWFGLGADFMKKRTRPKLAVKFDALVNRTIFRRRVSKYKSEK
jgi:N-acetylglucosaminyldiphosphoundecaprenol N-acetyl-beta-D-mannosaminyltransferase